MALTVIGFEGEWPEDAAVAWGAAAVRTDTRIVNAFTGLDVPEAELTELEGGGGITSIGDGVDLPEGQALTGLIVVAYRHLSPWASIFRGDPSSLALVAQGVWKRHFRYYVFADQLTFQDYIQNVVELVMRRVTTDMNPGKADFRELVESALILSAAEPALHAYRIAYSPNQERARATALSLIRSDAARQRLNTLVAALSAPKPTYELKYSGGIASRKGLASDIAINQLEALNKVHDKLWKTVLEDDPFVANDNFSPHLLALGQGSAILTFGVDLEAESSAARVARYLTLRKLQEAIRGNIPDQLRNDADFMRALRQVVAPTPDTIVEQKPIDGEGLERVSHFDQQGATDTVSTEPFSAFAFVWGIVGDKQRRVYLKLFPSFQISVSINNDGTGECPIGAEFLRESHDWGYQPVVALLVKSHDAMSRAHYHLKRIDRLKEGTEFHISAIPSSIVVNALAVTGLTIKRLPDRSFELDSVSFPDSGNSEHQADEWLNSFAAWAGGYESRIVPAGATWLRAPLGAGSFLNRLLLALGKRQQGALPSELVLELREARGSTNKLHIQSEAQSNEALIRVDDTGRLFLTEVGQRRAEVVRLAMLDP